VERRLFLNQDHFEGKKNQNRKKDKIMISTFNMCFPFEGMGHKIGNPIGKMDTPCHVPYNIRVGIPSSNSKWYMTT
jgi:hypothetical protein